MRWGTSIQRSQLRTQDIDSVPNARLYRQTLAMSGVISDLVHLVNFAIIRVPPYICGDGIVSSL